ncbi:hypothetical protein [Herbiconiux sp.]|uniref:hypothetical protein n=1 Tax=Herbiconiux sp. TaxID=1871186 RepID=UPI0025B84B97|nr:hypothetical protein [Herbiconiux sp.]
MTDLPSWIGDLPAWITTLAVAISASQYLAERSKRREEVERASQAQATHLSAWAVTDAGERRTYGIRLSNTSGSTFHDVRIDAVIHDRPVARPIILKIVPPGDYFIEHTKNGDASWELAQSVDEHDGWLRPLMQSDKYRVTRMTFNDNRNRSWATDDHAVLRMDTER